MDIRVAARLRPKARSPYQRVVAALSVLGLLALATEAQSTPPDEKPRLVFTDRVEVQWTLIPTVVRQEGKLVEDLTIDDFELLVDQRPVAIETFEAPSDAPASVVFLQDVSGSMRLLDKLETSRQALHRLLAASSEGDEFAIATFAGSRVELAMPFTGDLDRLVDISYLWQAEGTTGLYDAVTWLPKLSLEGREARRAAVVVTDGIDNASLIDPEEARRHVLRTQLPVYVLDLSHFGRSTSSVLEEGESASPLQLLASLTGGRYFRPLTNEQLARAGNEIARELRLQYVLGFASDSGSEGSSHRVEVRIPGRQTDARHRPEYFGPPPNWATDRARQEP